MEKQAKYQLWMEGLWIVITAVLVFGFMYPIWRAVDNFPFDLSNILHIVIFVTFARYIFLLRHTWLARRKWVKIILAVACIYLVIILTRNINEFSLYMEEYGLQHFMEDLPHKEQWPLVKYIRSEYLFFAVASTITAVLFPIRMVISIWRTMNRKNSV